MLRCSGGRGGGSRMQQRTPAAADASVSALRCVYPCFLAGLIPTLGGFMPPRTCCDAAMQRRPRRLLQDAAAHASAADASVSALRCVYLCFLAGLIPSLGGFMQLQTCCDAALQRRPRRRLQGGLGQASTADVSSNRNEVLPLLRPGWSGPNSRWSRAGNGPTSMLGCSGGRGGGGRMQQRTPAAAASGTAPRCVYLCFLAGLA